MSKTPCFTELFEGHPLNLGGESAPLNFGGLGLQGIFAFTTLQFPNAVVLSAVGRRKMQMSAQRSPKERERKTARERKSGDAEGSRNPWVTKFHGRLGC